MPGFWRALLGRGRAEKESRTGQVVSVWNVGQAQSTPRDYESFAREAYQRNIVAYRCISLIAEAASNIPWVLYRGDAEVSSHWLLDVLDKPNPMQDRIAFLEALYSFDLLAGNSYTESVIAGRSGELYALRPDRMRVVPGPNGFPMRYEYRVNGRTVPFDIEPGKAPPVLHMKRFNPLDDYYGQAPIEAAGYSVDQHNEGSKWNLSLLQNGMRPSGALQYEPKEGDQNLTDDQYRMLKNELDEQGSSKAGRPLLLDGGLKWVQTMLSQHDSDWLSMLDKTASQIAQAYNVPEQLVGVPGQQTYNNYREARLALYEDAVIPLAQRYASAFTEWLVQPLVGPQFRLAINEDDIPALAPRKEMQFDRLDGATFLTTNEKREALGYEPIEGGDTLMVPAGNLPLSFASEPPDLTGGMNPDDAAGEFGGE